MMIQQQALHFIRLKANRTFNTDLSPEETVEFYTKRGTMENYIKEWKHGFRMDKVAHVT